MIKKVTLQDNFQVLAKLLNDSNIELKNWYLRQGYVQTGTEIFDHLPFFVCFMDKDLPQ